MEGMGSFPVQCPSFEIMVSSSVENRTYQKREKNGDPRQSSGAEVDGRWRWHRRREEGSADTFRQFSHNLSR